MKTNGFPSSMIEMFGPLDPTMLMLPDSISYSLTPSKVWNDELIREIFMKQESKAILAIPLPHAPAVDRRFWRLTP